MDNPIFVPATDAERQPQPEDFALAVVNGHVLLRDAPGADAIPVVDALDALVAAAEAVNFIGTLAERPLFAIGGFREEPALPPGLSAVPLRAGEQALNPSF